VIWCEMLDEVCLLLKRAMFQNSDVRNQKVAILLLYFSEGHRTDILHHLCRATVHLIGKEEAEGSSRFGSLRVADKPTGPRYLRYLHQLAPLGNSA
jgi:hypothetical protein